MEKRDKAFTLHKKGMKCTEIAKKLDVSLNTVKSWKKRYWDAQKGAPRKPRRVASQSRVHRRAMSMQLATMAVHRRGIPTP